MSHRISWGIGGTILAVLIAGSSRPGNQSGCAGGAEAGEAAKPTAKPAKNDRTDEQLIMDEIQRIALLLAWRRSGPPVACA